MFIPIGEPCLGKKEAQNVSKCLKSGWISSAGKYIGDFEDKFARYCGSKYGVATSNGTTALHLALLALDIKEGDEVIIPDLTFVATANAVTYTRAKPVFVDCQWEDWNIDYHKIEDKINKRTKAIIVVHLCGNPAAMPEIMRLARRYNLKVIEDAAEAHGAEYKGRKVGSFGDIGCFSFYGNKIITTGEGGMCVTDSRILSEKMRLLRDHGMSKTRHYWHTMVGYNYRLTNIQAVIGLAQLERIEEFINRKIENASLYERLLRDVEGIVLPRLSVHARHVFWMYSVLVTRRFRIDRDTLRLRLREKGIDSRPFFYPLHLMPPYRLKAHFPVAEELSRSGIMLPSSVKLTEKQIRYIARNIKDV